jgi:hypothetical protein
LNKTSNKRWSGKIDALKADYLKDVMQQMASYGDRVQFSLSGTGQHPNYQIINTLGKKMGFDGSKHLLHANPDEFIEGNISSVFTLDQIKSAIAGTARTASAARVSRASGSGSRGITAAARAKELLDVEKYAYFKNNRSTLPPSIGEHSDEITELMQKGFSAEAAFAEVIKRHF